MQAFEESVYREDQGGGYYPPPASGGGGGGGPVSGPAPGPGAAATAPGQTAGAVPNWLSGTYTGIFGGKPISLSFSQTGQAQAVLDGHTYTGYIYTQLDKIYLWLNGDTSLISSTSTGIQTENLTHGGFVNYVGFNPGSTTPGPVINPPGADTSLGDLLSAANQGTQPADDFGTLSVNPGTTKSSPLLAILIVLGLGVAGYFAYKKFYV